MSGIPESIPAPGAATAAAVLPLLRLAMEESHAQLSGHPRSRDADAVWQVAEDLLSRELPEESLEVARLGAVLGLHYALFREFRDALTPEFREKFRRRVRLAVESLGRAFPAMRSPVQGILPDPVPGVVQSIILREISRHVQQHASVRGLAEVMHWSTVLLLEALARPVASRVEEIGPGTWMQPLTANAPGGPPPPSSAQPFIISGDKLIEELQSLSAREGLAPAGDAAKPPAAGAARIVQDESERAARHSAPNPAPTEPARREPRNSLRDYIGSGHPEFIAEMPAAQGRDSFQTGPVNIDLSAEASQLPQRRRVKKTRRRGRMKILLIFLALIAGTVLLLNKAYHVLPELRKLLQEGWSQFRDNWK